MTDKTSKPAVAIGWARMWPSYLVLAVSIVLCIVAYSYVRQTVRDEEDARFVTALDMLKQGLSERTSRYADVLLFARASCETVDNVTAEQWHAFVDSLDLRQRFPGTRALGYLQRVTDEELPGHVAFMRSHGQPGYAVRPLSDSGVHFPLLYSDPAPDNTPIPRPMAIMGLPRNGAGLDMYADPSRRVAMDKAADDNEPRATGKIPLLSESRAGAQSGFLIFVPLYRKGAIPLTPQERRAALVGFVYAPYRIGSLMSTVAGDIPETKSISFQVFDGKTASLENMIFDSAALPITDGADMPATRPAAGLDPVLDGPDVRMVRLTPIGRDWIIRAQPSSTSLVEYTDHDLPWLVLGGGTLVSLLLFGVSFLQMRGRISSERAALELAASERRLRASELRYRLKIEQSPVAVLTLSPAGEPLSVNRSWEQLWGLTLGDLKNYNIFADAELQGQGVMDLVRSAFGGETVTLGPLLYDAAKLASGARGRSRWVRSVLYPVRDPNSGEITEVVFMHEDITLRKEAEGELQRAKEAAESANHAKDQFLAVLSHELRNPLSPVLAMVDLLRSGDMTAAGQAEAMEVIRRNVELEARLIDDLLDVTRISRGKLHLDRSLVDAHVTLRHAVQICRPDLEAKHLRLEMELQAPAATVNADPARLQQVFWNLLKNAIKFTPEGGTITLRTRGLANAGLPLGEILIDVADTGIGIPADKLPRVFDAFEQADGSITRRFGGLGLGLTITRALVNAHNGAITVRSDGAGKGASFSVRFPVSPQAATAPAAARPAGGEPVAPLPGRKRILLIEDQADARRGLQLLLQRDGFDVTAVATAAEALEAAGKSPFDLFISDIGLPDLSGFDLLPRLRQLRAAPAIALTGFGMEQDIQRAADAGFELHLTKPVAFDRLLQAIVSLAASSS